MFKRVLPMSGPIENQKAGIHLDTLKAYERGDLNTNEIVSLGQDIYEAGVLPKLPPRYFLLIQHLKAVCLIHTHGRALH